VLPGENTGPNYWSGCTGYLISAHEEADRLGENFCTRQCFANRGCLRKTINSLLFLGERVIIPGDLNARSHFCMMKVTISA